MTGPGSVTVILATRNAAAFLPETLASLCAQTLEAFELVAVDDGSTDETADMLARHAASADPAFRPVTVLRTGPRGLAAARNLALRKARGEMIVVLDGDDILMPDLFVRARNRLAESGALDMAYPLFEHIGPGGERLGTRSLAPAGPLTAERLLVRNPIHSDSGVMVRKSAAMAAGLFDETLSGCIGLDFWRRVLTLRQGNAACLEDPLVLYRRRPGQITALAARMEDNFTRVLEKAGRDEALGVRARRRALAAQRLYWASLAYAQRDYGEARRHTASAWRTDPLRMARTPYAYQRAAIAAASILPSWLHEPLKRSGFALRARASR